MDIEQVHQFVDNIHKKKTRRRFNVKPIVLGLGGLAVAFILGTTMVLPLFTQHSSENARPLKAIEAAERYILEPTRKNRAAARAAAYAARAAHAAADAADAADAGYAADAAADAAARAAYAAYAAYAARAAADAGYAGYAAADAAAAARIETLTKIIHHGVDLLRKEADDEKE